MLSFNISIITTRWYFAIVFCIFSSCITKSKIIYKKIVEKSSVSNYAIGSLKYDNFKIKLNDAFVEKDVKILDSILSFMNVLILFDSNGNIKDLVGGNFTKNFESVSLAMDYYNFTRPINVSTLDNRIPQKLRLNLSDFKSIIRADIDVNKINDKNKVYMMIVPDKATRDYKKRLKKFNLPKIVKNNNFKLIILTKEQ